MATIKSALAIHDGMTGPIRKISSAMTTLIDVFENVQDVSANAVDTTSLQKARDLVADSITEWDHMADSVRGAGEAQEQFNNHIRDGANAADALGGKLKGILATVVSIAGVKSALGWVKENLELADTQRNAENQLKAVLANMGVEDVQIPVTVEAGDGIKALNNLENNLEALTGPKIAVDTSNAINAVNRFNRVANRLDGSTVQTTLNLDTGEAMIATMEYDDWANQTDGRTIQNSLVLDKTNQPGNLEATLTLNTGGALTAYDDFVNTVDGNTITTAVIVDTTQTMSAFDAIAAKASEIQGRGIYGDEAMIAGAAEFATYFSDAEAIISMMDTLSNYAMGMSGGGALDASAMVDYATNLGKIMTGAYDAMTKKGFEFSDAQKAVIEGTATHAQYVEALGADYQSMSDDMRAATVINSIIAESWDGLYEAMSNTPEGKIIQFNNKLGDLRETLGNRVYPAVLNFYDAFESHAPQIEQILTAFSDSLSTLIIVLTWVAEAAINIGSAFVDNWGIIGPVIGGVAAALLAYNAIQSISAGITAISTLQTRADELARRAQAGATLTAAESQTVFNAALLACPVFWIVAGIIAMISAIVAVVRALDIFGAKSHSVFGTLTGCINVAIQFFVNLGMMVANIALGIWNALGGCCSNIGTAFHNVIANVKGWFYGLLETVLRVVEGVCKALNKIPFVSIDYSGITAKADEYAAKSAEAYGSVEAYTSISDAFNEGFNTFDAFSSGWAQDAFNAGANWGDGASDTISDLFKMPTLGEMGLDSLDAFNLGNTLDGIYGNTGDTAANTAAAADSLDYMDEDLAWRRDIAEREAINRYTTAEITVQQENKNYISQDTDLDGVMEAWAFDFAEKLDVSAEGVHE